MPTKLELLYADDKPVLKSLLETLITKLEGIVPILYSNLSDKNYLGIEKECHYHLYELSLLNLDIYNLFLEIITECRQQNSCINEQALFNLISLAATNIPITLKYLKTLIP